MHRSLCVGLLWFVLLSLLCFSLSVYSWKEMYLHQKRYSCIKRGVYSSKEMYLHQKIYSSLSLVLHSLLCFSLLRSLLRVWFNLHLSREKDSCDFCRTCSEVSPEGLIQFTSLFIYIGLFHRFLFRFIDQFEKDSFDFCGTLLGVSLEGLIPFIYLFFHINRSFW